MKEDNASSSKETKDKSRERQGPIDDWETDDNDPTAGWTVTVPDSQDQGNDGKGKEKQTD